MRSASARSPQADQPADRTPAEQDFLDAVEDEGGRHVAVLDRELARCVAAAQLRT